MINGVPITYIPDFLPYADAAFQKLRDELEWVRIGTTPRSEYFHNSHGVSYTYGTPEYGRTYHSQPEHPMMAMIRGAIEGLTSTVLDACFLNRYHNQRDWLDWHSDSSPEMDDEKPIAIVSLGVERKIYFCPYGAKKDESQRTELLLQHGSLCLMAPGMQDTHHHKIPKSGFDCGERISLTYRGLVLNP